MDENVFTPLLNDPDIEIYLGTVNEKPAVSALLFKTDNVTGLHQMGVKNAFQGQGLAKKAMHLLIDKAVKHQSDYMVLQASPMGLPLYQSLGFESIFELKYLKRK
jgi:ribosomal protein S18 acetylase RimI-like enzyme